MASLYCCFLAASAGKQASHNCCNSSCTARCERKDEESELPHITSAYLPGVGVSLLLLITVACVFFFACSWNVVYGLIPLRLLLMPTCMPCRLQPGCHVSCRKRGFVAPLGPQFSISHKHAVQHKSACLVEQFATRCMWQFSAGCLISPALPCVAG